MRWLLPFLVLLASVISGSITVGADHTTACTVASVVDGDTFDCTDGTRVRLLQINTPESHECGGQWAKAALTNIFLKPGTQTRLEYDAVTEDQYGRHLAAPIVVGTDGTDYNISIVMVYVGLARAAYYGDNAKYLDWANASEAYARAAQWNMWQPGGPFAGGQFGDANCVGSPPPPPQSGQD
jgi:micrococcal nuclease